MKKLYFLILLLMTVFLFNSCQKEELNGKRQDTYYQDLDTSVDLRSKSPKEWFEKLLIKNYGELTGSEVLKTIEPRWDESIKWNESTVIVPCAHFVPIDCKGYTRLLIQKHSDGRYEGYFYTVIPRDQDQIFFSNEDVKSFNGRIAGFSILEGYIDAIDYENGFPIMYHQNKSLIRNRCPNCPWLWNAPETDGTGGGGWPPSWWPSTSSNIVCPNGCYGDFCLHNPDDCDDVEIIIVDIDESNIQNPATLIHDIGNSSGRGYLGGDDGGNGPLNQNPNNNNNNSNNPVDEAGLDEIECAQFGQEYPQFAEVDCGISSKIINICEGSADFEECFEEKLDEFDEFEEDECGFAMAQLLSSNEISISKSTRMLLLNNISGEVCSNPNDFKEEVINAIFDLIPDLDRNILDQLTSNGEPLNYLLLAPYLDSADEEEYPTCEECSVDQTGVLVTDIYHAKNNMDCARALLDDYIDGVSGSANVGTLLQQNFDSNSEALARFTNNILGWIRFTSTPYGGSYKREENDSGGLCGPTTAAWTYPTVQFSAIRLCDPYYWNQSSLERATTLVHEWAHLHYVAGDVAYEWETEYANLNTIEHLFNADSYATLVRDLCP